MKRDEHAGHEMHGDHHDHMDHMQHEGHGGHGGHMGHGGHDHSMHHAHMVADFRKRFWVSLILTVPVLLLAPMVRSFLGLSQALSFAGDGYVLFGFSVVIFFYGGWPFLKGMRDEMAAKNPGMMTLIALAIAVAFVYSSVVVFGVRGRTFFWELATLIDVMLLGHWIEMRSVMGASRALEELIKLMPSEAHKLKDDGSTVDVAVSDLEPDDKVVIKPGEKIPADGIVVDGSSSVNEAMITGESRPVTKEKDAEVIAGAINGEGSLTVAVKKTGKDSYLSQMVDMVQQAQAGKTKTQNLADRAARWLTGIAIASGVITFLVWKLAVGREFVFALERTVTVMVITCPHALGLAIPLVIAVSTALSARHGLLIRNRAQFERARNIQAVVFDKTGTLTKGTFEVTDTVALSDDMGEKTVRTYAASLEDKSEHPIAQAIAKSSDDKKQVADFKAITGKGVEGTIDGKSVKVVSHGYLKEKNLSFDEGKIDKLHQGGKTVVFLVVDNTVRGALALSDVVRDESKTAIAKLKEMGITTMMLTGDTKAVAEAVAKELGIDEYFAEVLPDKKVDKIKEVQSRGLTVAMVGDGINDAPALAQADVGIAIGAGTDVAAETADIILVRSNPVDVVRLTQYARATYKKMVQNLIWATGYNAVAIPLAAGVLAGWGILLSPAIGAVLMSLSTVIVAINAKFLHVPEAEQG